MSPKIATPADDGDKLLTTVKVARMTGLSVHYIIEQIDNKLLQGFRLPGSTHRRTTLRWVREWAKQYGVPLIDSTTNGSTNDLKGATDGG